MIGVVDYGLGNVQAFLTMYKRLNIPAAAVRNQAEVEAATKLILPGVGAFDHAMSLLNNSGMRDAVVASATERAVPMLGVCVGMQMMANGSDEGELAGLGLIQGRVVDMKKLNAAAALPMPHMGWNDIEPVGNTALFRGFEDGLRFYFLHSFCFSCDEDADVLARTQYGATFSCAVKRANVIGVQFHPEKSHHFGAGLLRNFAEM
jgi:imidazole glycerol-phosphate synthase subunit HisH